PRLLKKDTILLWPTRSAPLMQEASPTVVETLQAVISVVAVSGRHGRDVRGRTMRPRALSFRLGKLSSEEEDLPLWQCFASSKRNYELSDREAIRKRVLERKQYPLLCQQPACLLNWTVCTCPSITIRNSQERIIPALPGLLDV